MELKDYINKKEKNDSSYSEEDINKWKEEFNASIAKDTDAKKAFLEIDELINFLNESNPQKVHARRSFIDYFKLSYQRIKKLILETLH